MAESARPRKKASLLNWIGSRLKEVDRESAVDALVSAGFVKLAGLRISYASRGWGPVPASAHSTAGTSVAPGRYAYLGCGDECAELRQGG